MNERKVYDHISLLEAHNVVSEFLTKKAAEKFSKRKITQEGRIKETYVKISEKSKFGRYLNPGQKIYQVCLK